MRKVYIKFIVVLALALFAAIIVFPNALSPLGNIKKIGLGAKNLEQRIKDKYQFKLGLDLQGGSHLVYHIKNENLSGQDKSRSVESLVAVIRNRVDQFGVSESNIYSTKSGGQDYLTVELPGVKDLGTALDLIGRTAKLEFKVEDPKNPGQFVSNNPPLTGEHLRRAQVVFDQNSGSHKFR